MEVRELVVEGDRAVALTRYELQPPNGRPAFSSDVAGEVPADARTITAADREFAATLTNMTKVVFSRTLPPADDRLVINGNIAGELAALERRTGQTILLSCGPATLAPSPA